MCPRSFYSNCFSSCYRLGFPTCFCRLLTVSSGLCMCLCARWEVLCVYFILWQGGGLIVLLNWRAAGRHVKRKKTAWNEAFPRSEERPSAPFRLLLGSRTTCLEHYRREHVYSAGGRAGHWFGHCSSAGRVKVRRVVPWRWWWCHENSQPAHH